MKKTLLFLVLAIVFPFFAMSQGCLPDGIIFSSQEQIDSFPDDYPNCTEISGTVTISGDDITNLDGLYPVVSIGSYLYITNCNNLISITGLSNLNSLHSFFINTSNKLKTLSGLEGISTIEAISVNHMDSLPNLSGLDNLTRILDHLYLQWNNNLFDLSALNNVYALNYTRINNNTRLKSLNGLQNVLYSDMGIEIKDNDSLTDVFFDNLTYVKHLYIYRNPLLSIIGFPNLLEIREAISLQDNYQLQDFGDFGNLESAEYLSIIGNTNLIHINGINNSLNISQKITIQDNDNIISIIGFNGSTEVTELNIINNRSLQSIDGFENLIEVENSIEINDNQMLSSIYGFNKLEEIGVSFVLADCEGLVNLSSFNQLNEIGLDFIINNNDSLIDFTGLESLTKIGGSLEIKNNLSLINMNGLNSLSLIVGGLVVKNNAIISFEGLENLERIEFSFGIKDCYNLESLNGLNNLSNINWGLGIDNCDELINFSGMESLVNTGGYLSIKNNSKLKNFDGLGNIRNISGRFDILRNPSLVNFSGLNSLIQIGHLYVNNNLNLQNLIGLENLVSVNNGFIISDNSSIKNLTGIENLNSINVEVRLSSNDSLTSLEGLDNASLPQELSIYGNPFLSVCNTNTICNFLNENPDADVTIENNAPGCDHVEEVPNACELSGIFDPIVFPDRSFMPSWNILEISTELPNIAQTHTYYMEADTIFCGQKYSRIYLLDIEHTLYVRSTNKKTYYRSNNNCDNKEYLLYNYELEVGDTTWVGWEQYSQLSKDTVAFVLNSIDTIHQFGIDRKRFNMVSAEGDQIYEGSLSWVEGMGSEIHPFYPFAKLNTNLLFDYSLLCYDSSGVQLYQNPLWNTCDTNYTAVEEIDLKNTISISPNPFNSQLKIVSTIGKIQQVKIYSITGELVQEISSQNKHSIILNFNQEIPQGMYIIQVFTIDKMIQRKIMKL